MPLSALTRRLLAFSAILLPVAAQACPSPESLAYGNIRQDFTETRSLTGLPTPLRSSGHLVVTPDRVEWHTIAPFDIDTLITAAGMTQSVDGGPAQPVASGNSAVASQMTKIVSSLLRGDWKGLGTIFQVGPPQTLANQNWRITLHPLDPRLAGLLGEITVEGCSAITTFQLTQRNGDAERILFTPAAP
jgi:hypothetical protein